MSLPVYPAGLPYPQRNNYSAAGPNRIRRTEMDVGRAVQRTEFEDAPLLINATWRFPKDAQARLFIAWVNQVAKSGWFSMPLLTNMGFDILTVRLTTTPTGGQLMGKFIWEYNAVLEVEFEPMLPPDWAEILPDYVLEADIFDRAINQEWPLNPYDANRDASAFDYGVNQQWPLYP